MVERVPLRRTTPRRRKVERKAIYERRDGEDDKTYMRRLNRQEEAERRRIHLDYMRSRLRKELQACDPEFLDCIRDIQFSATGRSCRKGCWVHGIHPTSEDSQRDAWDRFLNYLTTGEPEMFPWLWAWEEDDATG